MIATILMEDTDPCNGLKFEHGFSVFVETDRTKLIVDSGASDATWENAKTLGVDVRSADMFFLSHGHYDHSDGLPAFAGINPSATVYMHPNAVLAYYNLGYGYDKYIGVDPKVRALRNISYIVEDTRISPEVFVFCHVTGRRKWPAGNLNLKVKQHDRLIQDSFDHELYTVVSENGKTVLISGCAHNGILNILDRFRAIYGRDPDAVISGFHTMKKAFTQRMKWI